jgi:hypothetical protein
MWVCVCVCVCVCCVQMCNLLIDFSPVRTQLVAHGVLALLISQLASAQPPHCDIGDVLREVGGGSREIGSEGGWADWDTGGGAGIWNELRLNSIWGLRNLSYKADAELMRCFVQKLGGTRLLEMLDPSCVAAGGWDERTDMLQHERTDMLEHALVILRNLCHWAPDGARTIMLNMDRVEMGQGFRKLLRSLAACVADAVPAKIAVAAIGAMSNMAANCPEVRLEIGMNELLLGHLHRGLTSGLRGPRVMSEIGWLLANVLPSVKPRSVATELGSNKPNAEHEHKEESDHWARDRTVSANGEACLVGTAQARLHGSLGLRSTLGGAADSEMAVVDKHVGEAEVGGRMQNLASEHGEVDMDSEILARMNRLSMSCGIRKLLGLRHLDSDLRRRLRQVLCALAGETSADEEQDENEGVDETEEEGVGEEEEQKEGGAWVIMTSDLQALEDNQDMEVDAEEVEEAEHDDTMSGEWQQVMRRGDRVESEGAQASVDEGEDAPNSQWQGFRVRAQFMTPGIRTMSGGNASGERAVGQDGEEDGNTDERNDMAEVFRGLERRNSW